MRSRETWETGMKWMGRRSRWRQDEEQLQLDVSESAGVRYLHLGSPTVQSAMRIGQPDHLMLAYTRTAMSFLLFKPEPAQVVTIGLGGGSMQKWLLRRLPKTHIHAVELHEEVVRAAQQYFEVPANDERLRIIVGDGAPWINTRADYADVLMVDGYDGRSQSESVCSEIFYRDALAHLKDDGILVVNLWGSDRRYDEYVARIEAAFDSRVLRVPALEKGNVIVLAFRRPPHPTAWDVLSERAKELEAKHQLEFTQFLTMFRRLNLHTEKRLLV
ncbi:MAG: spermidine synthase [Betaproteobacteria bacterium]|nr:spermidine synthase [Betaproteobacteria bacterium]